jgi:mycothiol system anti-sigma-R factor
VSKDAIALRCAGIQRFVDCYLDGEFADRDKSEFEAHLAECESCRNKVRVQSEWQNQIRAAAPNERAPAALRNRIRRSLARQAPPAQMSWRKWAVRVMPVAAASGLLLMTVVSRVNWSPVAADVIAKHQKQLPIEVTGGADQLKKWYADKVDFPVRPLELPHAALRGGRLTNIGAKQAAYLVYDFNGDKVSVFVFDPSDLRLEAQRKAVIKNREVYLDQERGYNVALFRDHGVGYAIASDLDSDEMLKLVSGAVAP